MPRLFIDLTSEYAYGPMTLLVKHRFNFTLHTRGALNSLEQRQPFLLGICGGSIGFKSARSLRARCLKLNLGAYEITYKRSQSSCQVNVTGVHACNALLSCSWNSFCI